MSIMASFKHQARRFAGRGARNMLAAGLGFLAITAAVAPSYAQQLPPTPIAAQSVTSQSVTSLPSYTPPPGTQACMKKYRDPADQAQCALDELRRDTEAKKTRIKASDQRIANANQRIAAANTQIATLESEKNCVDVVTTAFKNGQIDKDELRVTLSGRKPSEYGWPALAQKFNLKCG